MDRLFPIDFVSVCSSEAPEPANVPPSGVYVRGENLGREFPMGTRLRLRFPLPGGEQVEATGEVRGILDRNTPAVEAGVGVLVPNFGFPYSEVSGMSVWFAYVEIAEGGDS